MTDAIFLVGPDNSLVEARQARYRLEKDLQDLLAEHLELLPGSQIDRSSPRRWLLVRQEAGVPNEEGAGGWWAVDHLVVDQDAIPTFIEVKRSSDTRIRREVVAQMLEYAANGTAYWHAETLRAWFEQTHGGADAATARLVDWLQQGDEPSDEAADAFWSRVESNLRSGRVRCVFVADEIPQTLQRLVEFLNERLQGVEVLAVEIQQYQATTNGGRAIVPRVIGATAAANATKSHTPATQRHTPWTADEVLEDFRNRVPQLLWVPKRIVSWARDRGDITVTGGRGLQYPSITLSFDTQRKRGPRERGILMVSGGPDQYASLEVRVRRMWTTAPFRTVAGRQQFEAMLNKTEIPALVSAFHKNEIRPNLPLQEIEPTQLEQLLGMCDDWCRTALAANEQLDADPTGEAD